MNRTRNLLISTVSAVAIAALPFGINFSATGWLGLSVASAKNDKSSEKSDDGSGAGKGGAGKQGKSSDSSGAGKGAAGKQGKSSDGSGAGKGGAGKQGKSSDSSGAGKGAAGKQGKSSDSSGAGKGAAGKQGKSSDSSGAGKGAAGKQGKSSDGSGPGNGGAGKQSTSSGGGAKGTFGAGSGKIKLLSSGREQFATLPEKAPVPPIIFYKKLKATVARLTSVEGSTEVGGSPEIYANPRPHAQSPTGLREFVVAQAKLDIANKNLAAAYDEFDSKVGQAGLTPFNDPLDTARIYSAPTLSDLKTRLAELQALDSTSLTGADQAELAAERMALEALLTSEKATNLAKAEAAVASAMVGNDDQTLRRLSRYGEETVNADAMKWAKEVLRGKGYVNDDVRNWAEEVLGIEEDSEKVQVTLQIDQL